MIPCSLTIFSHPLLENVLKKRIKLIFFNMRMNISVDTSYWGTPISIREVIINKQLDFIRKEVTKYKAIRYVHHNEMGIPVSYGEDVDKPFLLGQT